MFRLPTTDLMADFSSVISTGGCSGQKKPPVWSKNPRSRRSAHEPAHPLPGLIEIAHKTIGIVAVAAFAASGETPPPVAAITAT